MHPTEQTINDYVDGVLSSDAHAEVERHVESCAECALLVAELQHIIRAAGLLPPIDPPAHVWARIAPAVGARGASLWGRRRGLLLGLAAAAALIITTVAGVRYLDLTSRSSPSVNGSFELALLVESELLEAEGHYQKAISGLQQIADAENATLDPETAAALKASLAVIDQAINESRAALKVEPNSALAQVSLLEGLKAKVTLLQGTVELINETRAKSRG